MGPVLLREETGVPGENLQCLVTFDRGNFNQITALRRNRILVNCGEKYMHCRCNTIQAVQKPERQREGKG